MVEEAALSGLEIVEALLQSGARVDAARLAQEILGELRDVAFNDRALFALAYLSDAAQASRASAETARHVRGYIDSLREDPTREFVML
jgi:NAD(P)-dependent dehydrogenase (short-subunit alcohol dehydrogenase family)